MDSHVAPAAARVPGAAPPRQSDAAPELVLVGNLLVDDIVLRDGQTLLGEPGGAVLHAALAASLWGVRIGVSAIAGNDYPAAALEALDARGVDLQGVQRLTRPGGRAWLLYEPRARRVVHHLDSPAHEALSPQFHELPAPYRQARAFHLAPMPIARQCALARGLAERSSSPPFVSLDPYEAVHDANLDQWRTLLRHVDAFFPSEDEIRLAADPVDVLRPAGDERLQFVFLKRGAQGGMLMDCRRGLPATEAAGLPAPWTPRAAGVVDATGAGDAFVGGFLAGWLAHGDPWRGIEQGVVSASFALQDWGARGLLAASPTAARQRHAEWFAPEAASEATSR